MPNTVLKPNWALAVILPWFVASWAVAIPVKGACSDDTFTDVPKDHWAYLAVTDLQRMEILIGYPAVANKDGSQNPKYDQRTPPDAWKSLVMAMRAGDESGLRGLLTEACYANNDGPAFKFQAISADLAIRQKVYKERARDWSKRQLILDDPRSPGPDTFKIHATLVDTKAGPDLFDTWINVEMRKFGKSWRVTAVYLG